MMATNICKICKNTGLSSVINLDHQKIRLYFQSMVK